MKLEEIARHFSWEQIRGDLSGEVSGCSSDSRSLSPGDLFLAIQGENFDGHNFVLEALQKGAVGVVASKEIQGLPFSIPLFITKDTREIAGPLSSFILGEPSKKIKVLGVTGTCGKTTTCHFLKAGLQAAGERAEIIGSLNPTREHPSHTTPEAPALQRRLHQFVEDGVDYAVVEVSSHAIHFQRVEGISFMAGLLTNIYRDHLELHGSLENYGLSKINWLNSLGNAHVAFNLDFPNSERWLKLVRTPTLTCSLSQKADIQGKVVEEGPWGSRIRIDSLSGSFLLKCSLPGKMNASNALVAFTLLYFLGLEPEKIIPGFAIVESLEGRYRIIQKPGKAKVLIDYAHNPAGLEEILHFARGLSKKVILVFGCVGKGDRGKRPIMGQIAGQLADLIFLTTDDPRGEDPWQIIRETENGLKGLGKKEGQDYYLVADRRQAIEMAIRISKEGDIVVIAGRGHEKYQKFADHLEYLDDEEEAERVLAS